jgi:hypothetical protein
VIRRYLAYDVDVDAPAGYNIGPLVGGTDALATSDGATSYASVSQNGLPSDYATNTNMPTYHFLRFGDVGPIPADATVTLEADWRTSSEGSVAFFVGVSAPEVGGRSVATFNILGTDPRPDFGTVQTRPVPSYLLTGFPEYFTAAAQWQIFSATYSEGIAKSADVTRLTLVIETATQAGVRLLGRGDGINSGSNRLIGVGTPQSSVRLLGSL